MSSPAAGRLRLRPILIDGRASGQRGTVLAGGWLRFGELAVESAAGLEILPAAAVAALHPEAAPLLARLSRPRTAVGRLVLDRPHVVAVAGAVIPPDGGVGVMASGAATMATVGAGAPDGHREAAPAWRAPHWQALREARLPEDRLLIGPPPAAALDGPATVASFLDHVAGELDGAEGSGFDRSRVIVDLGTPAPAALGSLAMLHALGAPLMLHASGGAARVAATAVLAAGQGVQLICADDTAAAVAALDLWRAATSA